jgi:hypothetical protein
MIRGLPTIRGIQGLRLASNHQWRTWAACCRLKRYIGIVEIGLGQLTTVARVCAGNRNQALGPVE